jgi:hypothetical protein
MNSRPEFLFAFLLLLPACGAPAATHDVTATSLASDGGDVWFVVRPDRRTCAPPACGGRFVKAVNVAHTVCADGVRRAECYVADIDWSATQLGDSDLAALEGKAVLVRGAIVALDDGGSSVRATEVWTPAVPEALGDDGYPAFAGALFRAVDNGTRCVAAPCPSITQETLNTGARRDVAGVELDSAGADAAAVAAARQALTTPQGLIVDGDDAAVSGPAGAGSTLAADDFFLRVVPRGPERCGGFIGLGCADGEYCDIVVDNACHGYDLPGVCKPVPEVCYHLWQPVCGCDGKTYPNDCERLAARVQRDHDGACAE